MIAVEPPDGSTPLARVPSLRSHLLPPRLRLARALGLALCMFGCDAFDSDRKPYTPFPTASGDRVMAKPSPTPEPLEPAPASNGGGPALLDAPPDATRWQINERLLDAPPGLVFRSAVVSGLAGTQPGDVVAWLEGTKDKPVVGELWFYPVAGPARALGSAPGFLPTGPSCEHATKLSQTGPASLTLDIQATCTTPLLPRAPVRAVSVIAPLRSPALIAGFQLAAPAEGERLEPEIVSLDRDGDGRDDVELDLRFGVSGDADVFVRFVWLDRPAGLSRDTTEPLASFTELATLEAKRAQNRKSSLDVERRLASIRRAYASACADSGVPRVFNESGAGLDCGNLAPIFQTLTRAGIDAALSRGQSGDALGELDRHDWFPTGDRAEHERFMRDQLARVLERTRLKARPRPPEAGPRFSRLSFHADGSLLLLAAEGTIRAAPDGRFEYDASDEVDAWSTRVTSAAGQQLIGISYPCERSEVAWLLAASDGRPLPPLNCELSAPRPGNCRGAQLFTPPPISPIGWSEAGISAFVGATRVGPLLPQAPMGSALSPNGRYAIAATQWGLLVSSGDQTAFWVFDDPALSSQLDECVVSNNAQAAACFLTGRAYVILPDPK